MSSFFLDAVLCLFPLVRILNARSDSADLDLLQWRSEVHIKRKRICRIDITPWWMFLEYLPFGAGQRLQIALQLNLRY